MIKLIKLENEYYYCNAGDEKAYELLKSLGMPIKQKIIKEEEEVVSNKKKSIIVKSQKSLNFRLNTLGVLTVVTRAVYRKFDYGLREMALKGLIPGI